MEVNGRFWGSLQLAIDCGVDFPWLLYQLAQDLPVLRLTSYAVGRRLRWILGDLDSLLIELKGTPSTFSDKTRAIWSFIRSFADTACRQEILRLDDWKPAISESWLWAREFFK